MPVSYRGADVDGFTVFYREAGPADAAKLLLLHGFPSAGHMFRDLIPLLADRFHVIAPDLPGFGQSDMPPRGKFTYTFDNVAKVIERFTEVRLRPVCGLCLRLRRSHGNVSRKERRTMRFRSIATLAVFAAAAIVALKYPFAGLAMCRCCLIVYLKPEAPGVET
jgi:hypothetical protein